MFVGFFCAPRFANSAYGEVADINAAAVQRLDELVYSRNESVAVQAIRLALDHTRKLQDGTQGQADAPLCMTPALWPSV